MSMIVDKRLINLSSTTGIKQNGLKNSNIQYDFPNLLTAQPDIIYAEIGVVSAEIPVSFYTVNEFNNTLNIIWSPLAPPPPSANYLITIPQGNYSATTFLTELVTLIYTAVGFGGSLVDWLSITINKSTGRLLWVADMAIIGDFQLIQSGSTCWYIIGGGDTAVYPFTLLLPSQILDHPLTLLGTNKITIATDNLNTYSYDSHTGGFSNILASIEVDAPAFGIVLYKNASITYNILRVLAIQQFSIELKDDFRRYIDFNNVEWTITLSLNIHRHVPKLSSLTFKELLEKHNTDTTPPHLEEKKGDIKEPDKDKKDLDMLTS